MDGKEGINDDSSLGSTASNRGAGGGKQTALTRHSSSKSVLKRNSPHIHVSASVKIHVKKHILARHSEPSAEKSRRYAAVKKWHSHIRADHLFASSSCLPSELPDPMLGLSELIPVTPGLLPKWQLLVAVMAVFNTAQNFVTLKLTRRIYDRIPADTVTALQARTFAIWTLTSAVVRLYAAYHIEKKVVYDMALFTYLIAFGHFTSETFIFHTASINPGTLGPFIVSTSSLIWMIKQYDFYVYA